MFRGVSNLSLDDKGRLAIPSRYRAELQECCNNQLVLTVAPDASCLTLYPLPVFEALERQLAELPALHERTKRLLRLISGHATDCEPDGQGRFLIPEALRRIAKLGKRVALVGQPRKFEIWDEETWFTSCDNWVETERSIGEADLPPEFANLTL